MSVARSPSTRLAKLTMMHSGKIVLKWVCLNCGEEGEEVIKNTQQRQIFGVSLRAVKLFVRRARAHCPTYNHRVRVSIVDERDYCIDFDKLQRAKRQQ